MCVWWGVWISHSLKFNVNCFMGKVEQVYALMDCTLYTIGKGPLSMGLSACVCMWVCLCIRFLICVYLCALCVCGSVCVFVSACVFMCACTYICMSVRVCVYMCV